MKASKGAYEGIIPGPCRRKGRSGYRGTPPREAGDGRWGIPIDDHAILWLLKD